MSKEAVVAYIKHIDAHGLDMVEDTVRRDRSLTDEERAAIMAYVNIKKTTPPKRRTKGTK